MFATTVCGLLDTIYTLYYLYFSFHFQQLCKPLQTISVRIKKKIDQSLEKTKFRQDPTSIGEENEAFFIRVWKPLPSRHVLKTLRGSSKGKALKRTIGGGLGPLQMVSESDIG